MSSLPPKMSAPLDGPSAPLKKSNPTLIVLAVIGGLAATCCIGMAVLIAVLGPVFRLARAGEQSARCVGNLRRIGSAISLYAADNDERLPNADQWMDQVERFGGGTRQFQCPAVRSFDRGGYGYAFNKALSGKSKSEIDPKTQLVFDSSLLLRNANSGAESMPVPGRHIRGRLRVDHAVLEDGSSFAVTK